MEYEDCDKPKYNIKDTGTLTHKPGRNTFVRLPPEKFQKLVMGSEDLTKEQMEKSGVDFTHKEDVKEAMCKGEPLEPMYLDYNQDQNKITSHEGRMRSQAAKEVGMKSIPVQVFCRNDDYGFESCNIRSGIDLRRKAEPQMNIKERFQ